MDTLMPCAFCGSEDLLKTEITVVCLTCLAVGPRAERDTVESAIEAWNKRVYSVREPQVAYTVAKPLVKRRK